MQFDADQQRIMRDAAQAFHEDAVPRVQALLAEHPFLRQTLDEPLGPFDSPLIIHVRSRAMLDALVEAGADIDARSHWWAGGFGILDYAAPDIALYAVERGARVDAHAAARLGLIDTLRSLLARDPGLVHARGGDGQTPLHFAKDVDIAALLLDAGADINALDVDHESTPAQYMTGDRLDVARYLVERGCKTDLLLAAAGGDLACARRLLDVNPAAVRIRVDSRAFPMRNPKAGGTIYQWTLGFHASPHQVAYDRGHAAMRELLMELSSASLRIIEACWVGDAPAVARCRSTHPVAAGAFTDDERVLIAHAARNNRTDAVRLMLECGLPVDARGQHQATPLHWAAFHGNAEMAAAILQYSPPLEVTDADFSATPLGWATHGSAHGWYARSGDYASTVEHLLRAGAARPATISGSPAVQAVLRAM